MAIKSCSVRFTVVGRGDFPLDMLRYDRCFPRTGNDAAAAQSPGETRTVELTRDAATRYWRPCEGRWQSFGWTVTEVTPMDE
ncbi:MAG TPA: hypothetical protein VF681_05775 [Abditibacteriaceae bacterium]|jgi:hypothetical protein